MVYTSSENYFPLTIMKSFVIAVLALATVAQAGSNYYHPVKFQLDQSRVVGGKEATPHSYPYQVAMLMTNAAGQQNFCGGSLLTTKIVLTAAHCVDGFKSIEVILGAHRMDEVEDTQVRIVSTDFVVHEGWSMNTLKNDIALVKLPRAVELNENIALTKLPSRADEHNHFTGQTVTISGWGKDSDSSNGISRVLREVSAPVITNLKCSISYPFVIKNSHLCASGAGGKSSCNGDSGGPLVIKTAGSIQVGIVSFGKQHCETGSPAVYTRVTSYLDWIEKHAGITIN